MTIGLGIVVALCGVCVGILSAMFGIGGGIVMVPLIHIAFGQPAAIASGTSLFAILPTSLSGMIARLHDGTIHFPVGIVAGLAGACLSPLGALAASTLPGFYAMVLTSLFIFFTAYNMFKRVYRTSPRYLETHEGKQIEHSAPLAQAKGARLYGFTVVLGAVVGFLSGYVGLGGGFLIVPMLQWAFGYSMKEASGTSLVAVGILAIPSFITHAILGNVLWVVGILLIVGSVFGTKIGAFILQHVNNRRLTALFGVLLVASGVILAVQEIVG